MSVNHSSAVVLTDVSFAWPDGTAALEHLSAAFELGRTGLIGRNGSGKSTLLRLIAGDLTPTTGSIGPTGEVGYLPQQLALRAGVSVAELLGIRERIEALRAIESGSTSAHWFDVLGDDWDVEARARVQLDLLGMTTVGLDRHIETLSGGEIMLAALAGLRLGGPDIVLLDEPTNDLDRQTRRQLYEMITGWRGTLIVVSHDTTLLDLMDDIAELRAGSLTVFGGSYSQYCAHVDQQQAAAQQALRTAEQNLKTEQRQRIEAQTKLARRRRYANTDFENRRKPKMIMKQRKTEAQVSAGKLRTELDEKIASAHDAVQEQAERVRRDDRIRIELPDTEVAAGRRLAELRDAYGHGFVLQGPERFALTGRNGVGKTRLVETLIHPRVVSAGEPMAASSTGRIGFLPQRLDHLDDDLTLMEAVRRGAPHARPADIRANLARFLFRGDVVERRIGALSGGERFRAALAVILLADPPPELLVLDEPTNNLDLASVNELVDALASYRGGLIVVSHDEGFLARVGIDTWITLERDGRLR